ncbi:protein ECERIFERUM 2 [Corylus avellana]|uniref:protein ECERIFERUM 2 n=1 Tax=Corylus avellana TaxID=13451 RepID=UPI00286A24ED|nr:protein ECERIFERUM 2 [Corylus avellana]
MVSTSMGSPEICNRKLTTAVPATQTGENKVSELTDMDLAMKLHYIEGVYFFTSEAAEGLRPEDLKGPLFHCLSRFFTASGRVRRSETGRPFIKCNDSGIRIVEADCDQTIEQVLATKDHSFHSSLAYTQHLGPDLGFSPLVIIQFTRFKHGGVSVGLSWAHVLGDAFAAIAFINLWGQILSGHAPPKCLHAPIPRKPKFPPTIPNKSIPTLKRVDPVGDCWLTASICKMDTNYFHVTAEQLEQMVAKARAVAKISHFQVLSAIIWKYLSEIREGETRIVTICKTNSHNRENEYPTNAMVLSAVEADFSVAKADISELAELIAEKRVEENEEMVEIENGEADYIAYGANLTFVNLEEAKIYGLEMKGNRPAFANYAINGVGDEGVVLVLPGPINGKGEGDGRDGLVVSMVLPENQFPLLINKLERDWNVV